MTTKKPILSAIEQKAISILNRFDPEHLASTKNPSISLYLHPPTHTAKGILAALVHNHGDLVPKPTEYPTALRAHTSEALEPSLLSTATPLARVKAEIGAGTGAQGGHRVSTGVEGERRAGVKRKAAVAEINHSGVALALPPNPKRKAFQHYYPAAAASATTLIYAKSMCFFNVSKKKKNGRYTALVSQQMTYRLMYLKYTYACRYVFI
ncbi:hypothetical protein AAMO2058_000245200 [Amorphochlora amoebiformis]